VGNQTGAGEIESRKDMAMYKDQEDRVSEAESAVPTEGSNAIAVEKVDARVSGEGGRRASSLGAASQTFVPPNGGLEAWLLVLAGFLVFSNTW